MTFPPIPPHAPLCADVPPIKECGEPLVSLPQYSPRLLVYPYYHAQKWHGSLPDCPVRESVAQLLARAADHLPPGFRLVILDGWRPLSVQQALFDQVKQSLLEQNWTDGAALEEELCRYVAKPSADPYRPPRHLTGGAVDLTIAGPDGWLDMGTSFDDFSERARTRFFEEVRMNDEDTRQIRDNRRLLYHVMTDAGFTNYPEEWWHYDYGNQAWAATKGLPAARYGGITSR